MKNTIKNNVEKLKNFSKNKKDNLKKVTQAFWLSAMLAITWCSDDGKAKNYYEACRTEIWDKEKAICNKKEFLKEKQEKKYQKEFEAFKLNLNEVYDIIEKWKEPEYFLREFNELKEKDKVEIIDILLWNEKIKLRSKDVNEKYFVFIIYLIEKNNLEEFNWKIDLFWNVDIWTLFTYRKYSSKNVNFENLKNSDYSSEIYKYIGELNLKKEDYTEEFLLNIKDNKDIYYIVRYYPWDIKDLSIISGGFVYYDFYRTALKWFPIYDYRFPEMRSIVKKEELLECFEVYLNSWYPYLDSLFEYKNILDEDFVRVFLEEKRKGTINFLSEIKKEDKDLLNKLFYSLSEEEQQKVFDIEKENIKNYLKEWENVSYKIENEGEDEKWNEILYTYSKIIDNKKIYLD